MSYLPPDAPFSLDITFCNNAGCPFTDCKRHLTNLEVLRDHPGVTVSCANLCGVCRKYLYNLVEELNEETTSNPTDYINSRHALSGPNHH